MNRLDTSTCLPNQSGLDRLSKKSRVFELIRNQPDVTAPLLQRQANQLGINLSLIGAYRVLRAYRQTGGRIEDSDTDCLRQVVSILQAAASGEHLCAGDIEARARLLGSDVHRATIYRILGRLEATGLVQSLARGRQKFYEWKRDDGNHGHLTCIECGKTAEFAHRALDAFGQQVCARLGYEFTGMEFTVRSLCGSCR